MKIELNCASCGGNRFVYPERLTSESLITCGDCRHEIGTVAELQQRVINALESRSAARNDRK